MTKRCSIRARTGENVCKASDISRIVRTFFWQLQRIIPRRSDNGVVCCVVNLSSSHEIMFFVLPFIQERILRVQNGRNGPPPEGIQRVQNGRNGSLSQGIDSLVSPSKTGAGILIRTLAFQRPKVDYCVKVSLVLRPPAGGVFGSLLMLLSFCL